MGLDLDSDYTVVWVVEVDIQCSRSTDVTDDSTWQQQYYCSTEVVWNQRCESGQKKPKCWRKRIWKLFFLTDRRRPPPHFACLANPHFSLDSWVFWLWPTQRASSHPSNSTFSPTHARHLHLNLLNRPAYVYPASSASSPPLLSPHPIFSHLWENKAPVRQRGTEVVWLG